jgi:hypothetical protein
MVGKNEQKRVFRFSQKKKCCLILFVFHGFFFVFPLDPSNIRAAPVQSAVWKVTVPDIDEHFSLMLRKCLAGNNDYGELVSPYSNKNSWKTACCCSTMTDQIKRPSFSSSSSSSSFNTILTGHEQCKLFIHNDKFSYINSRRALDRDGHVRRYSVD